jgi:hypothetical protein
MAEIIDIMTPAIDRGAQFTVNVAALYVPIVQVPAATPILYTGSGASKFVHGDNFLILSAGYFIPECFSLANFDSPSDPSYNMAVPQFMLTAYGLVTAINYAIGAFGNGGLLRIPFPNYEMSIGTFVDVIHNALPINEGFQLQLDFPIYPGAMPIQANVSMVNVPAALDTKVIYITPFLKVLHNLPLTF